MTKSLFLIFFLAVACNCRPQTPDTSTVEVEKQEVIEVSPRNLFEERPERQVEEHTKEILAKIAQVNKQQGLDKKKTKPLYQFPFSYLRSQQVPSRQSSDFKFPRDPFTNPIFEYVESLNSNGKKTNASPVSGLVIKNEVKPEQIDPSDIIPGHYIKRKIVHQQSVLVPNPMYYNAGPSPQYYNFYGQTPLAPTQNSKDSLEKQTVENVKNIIGTSQYPPVIPYNPYAQFYYQANPSANYQIDGDRPGRQFQSPLGQYFPIMIKDPLVQLFNAMTSMIEYGPNVGGGGGGNACKNKKKPMAKDAAEDNSVELEPKEAQEENDENDDSILTTILEIEDLQIGNNETTFRQSKHNQVAPTQKNATKPRTDYYSKHPVVQAIHVNKPIGEVKKHELRQSPPVRDQALNDDELASEEDTELDKAEDILVNNDGVKKMFSKDNTGSGIFIHKLKVRKGGVAIAGPGGIATAGSGGTAIVGPNGYAYTHPDSLAIAGTGTKVISVDPSINLADIVNDNNKNKTRGHGQHPRVGKVVAVGPVIYYNKG